MRFAHCDPAGMVFYPRYLEMFNNLVEDWCREELRVSFAEMHTVRGWGLPTVHLEAEFMAPSFLGEVLPASISVRSLGTSSITLDILLRGPDGIDRVRGSVVLVMIDLASKRPLTIHGELRSRILESCAGTVMPTSVRARSEDKQGMEFLKPGQWVNPKGYSNGVAAKGRTVFVSGMVGWDAQGKFVSREFVGQGRQALKNIVDVLAEANARPEHIARVTWYVVDKNEYLAAARQLGEVYREIIGRHYPAMTVVEVTALIEDQARLEIEVTAVVPD